MDFLIVIMASSIARGHIILCMTTTVTELHKMAVILQLIGWQRHAVLVYSVRHLILGIHIAYYGKLIPLKIRYLHDHYHMTTSELSWAQVRSYQGHILFLKLTTDQVLVFDWITGSLVVIRAWLFGSQLTLTQDYENIIEN